MKPELDLGYVLGLPPEEAIRYFEGKGLVTTGDWRALWQEQHAKAFTVARLARLDILNDIYSALKEALKDGLTEREVVKRLMPILQAKGWWGPAIDKATGEVLDTYDPATGRPVEWGSPRRLKLIYRQNMQTAYMAGRYKAQAELARRGARPYWQYVAVRDSRTRPTHAALHGRVWRADDPIWDYLYPPNGWNCRCRVRALSEHRLAREGLTVESSEGMLVRREVSAGKLPDGSPDMLEVTGIRIIDRDGRESVMLPDAGWSYNPGKAGVAWRGLLDAAEAKITSYAAAVGAASRDDLHDLVLERWATWIEEALQGDARDRLGWLGVISTRDLAHLMDAGIIPQSAEVMVRAGIVNGPKARRHDEAGNALTEAQWRALPHMWQQATALMMDLKSGKPLWILPGAQGRAPQLAVEINFVTGRVKRTTNAVVSAYTITLAEMKNRLKAGGVRLLWGRLG